MASDRRVFVSHILTGLQFLPPDAMCLRSRRASQLVPETGQAVRRLIDDIREVGIRADVEHGIFRRLLIRLCSLVQLVKRVAAKKCGCSLLRT